MSFPASHKTVIVLDHGAHFAQPCHPVEVDVQRARGPGAYIPLAPVSKSVWTCVVEATLEYCRIVWDLFPVEKCIRFVVRKNPPEILNGWKNEHQNTASIMTALAGVGRPTPDRKYGAADSAADGGIDLALESLCEPTEKQVELLEAGKEVINRGRMIIITTIIDDFHRKKLIRTAQDKILKINQETEDNDMKLDHVELVIIHTTPTGMEYRIHAEQDMAEVISPTLTTLFYTVTAGPAVSMKLLYLCLKHYDLASTTVTGIPMKEEQNASSSANYDVELFHQAESHKRLLGDFQDMVLATSEGNEYQTCKLKWCTPRGSSASELHHCSAAFRITPTEVNSRQSSCLTNFLLSGRSVMLEMQRRSSGVKTISHMLTSHGGEIFIHTLSSSRSLLEDPPSISEGPGGRVTDYRIRELSDLIKCNLLAPFFGDPTDKTPLDKAQSRLTRFTRFLPSTISSTTLFNLPVFEPLHAAMLKENLTDEDLTECRKVIFAIMSMEQKGEPLPGPLGQPVPVGKKSKREEQYRGLWNELEMFATAHSEQSPGHQAVLECLLEVRQKPILKKDEKVGLDAALRELDKLSPMNDSLDKADGRKRSQSPHSTASGHAAGSVTGGGGGSCGPNKKVKLVNPQGHTLLQLYTARKLREAKLMHKEFAARQIVGSEMKAVKLYLKLEKEGSVGPANNGGQ
eukprot:TRINITY_DN3844_c0_g1_i3.p1 TRINITY_DN3844_c0_g1~~TRINITY_DN3844_c0_g1_i3.p1  ORF type:complete len:686 (+),score=153.62 TRINITY_DN3844_c0_g1_i3:627-2684(+)